MTLCCHILLCLTPITPLDTVGLSNGGDAPFNSEGDFNPNPSLAGRQKPTYCSERSLAAYGKPFDVDDGVDDFIHRPSLFNSGGRGGDWQFHYLTALLDIQPQEGISEERLGLV